MVDRETPQRALSWARLRKRGGASVRLAAVICDGSVRRERSRWVRMLGTVASRETVWDRRQPSGVWGPPPLAASWSTISQPNGGGGAWPNAPPAIISASPL